jgi:RND family efflux transporter MFP subunit
MKRDNKFFGWVFTGARGILLGLGFTVGVVVLLLWLAGKFEKKVSTEVVAGVSQKKVDREGHVIRVKKIRLTLTETAVGTIRSVHEASIRPETIARVIEVNIKAGQRVKIGDILFRLDDTDLRAKLEQAKAAVESAKSTALQAEADAQRAKQLLPAKAISQQDYEKAQSFAQTAKADVDRFEQSLKAAQVALDRATIRSPLDGVVIDKRADVGDLALPENILATLYNPDRMQLVASVRDSLANRIETGQNIDVQVEGIEHRCKGLVSEKVPESQSDSRSFQVKVTGPCPPDIHSGVFGRIYIPLGEEEVLAIPKNAVRHVGQLELAEVAEDGKTVMRSIRTGRTSEDNPALEGYVEILSGLQEGEEVVAGLK